MRASRSGSLLVKSCGFAVINAFAFIKVREYLKLKEFLRNSFIMKIKLKYKYFNLTFENLAYGNTVNTRFLAHMG